MPRGARTLLMVIALAGYVLTVACERATDQHAGHASGEQGLHGQPSASHGGSLGAAPAPAPSSVSVGGGPDLPAQAVRVSLESFSKAWNVAAASIAPQEARLRLASLAPLPDTPSFATMLSPQVVLSGTLASDRSIFVAVVTRSSSDADSSALARGAARCLIAALAPAAQAEAVLGKLDVASGAMVSTVAENINFVANHPEGGPWMVTAMPVMVPPTGQPALLQPAAAPVTQAAPPAVSPPPAPVLSEAEAKAERERWLASGSEEQWTMLTTKYPGSDEAVSAAWKLTERSSVCAQYGSYLPYNFSHYLLFDEEMTDVVLTRTLEWGQKKPFGDLIMAVGGAYEVLKSKKEAAATLCEEMRQHRLQPSEEDVKASLLGDCQKVLDRLTQMEETLLPPRAAADEMLAGRLTLAQHFLDGWERLATSKLKYGKRMLASADKRQAMCKRIGAPPWNTSPSAKTGGDKSPRAKATGCVHCFYNGDCKILQDGPGQGDCCEPIEGDDPQHTAECASYNR